MQILILSIILMFFAVGCDKFPFTQSSKKESVIKEIKTKTTVKIQPKEIKTTQDIQVALTNAGYYKGPVNGKKSSAFEQAIKQFQKNNGLSPDGIVGKKTKLKLSKFLK